MSGKSIHTHHGTTVRVFKGALYQDGKKVDTTQLDPKTKLYWCPTSKKWRLTQCECDDKRRES